MSHLIPERLAALSDETPTPIEAAHLITCDDCSAELAAHRRMARLAVGAQSNTTIPVSNFNALMPRLRAEGLVQVPDRAAVAKLWAARIAAGLVLVVGGAVGGRLTATKDLPGLAAVTPATSSAGTTVPLTSENFKTTDDAVKALEVSQQAYSNAAAFLAAQDTSAHFIGLNQKALGTRLAALDQMAAVTRSALYQAPQDPVLNRAFLGVQSAREATLQQINQTMPSTKRLGAY